MVGELVVTQSLLRPENASVAAADSPLARNLAQLARITAEVQKTTMSMRMVPVGQLFQRLSRLVRDVSRQVGKAIDLELSGEEIELDRSMVEELADPLMHMIRNSIDHGIEDPAERKGAGKSPTGRIFLQARHDAGQVQIRVSDDGRGLNRDRILAKAAQKGLVDPNAQISDADIYNLIFEPGFSTAETVSDLSGRGVGMDVVRRQIQKLRGRVDLRSTPGEGTTFLLRLPLTLAIIDGLVISLASNRYIIPVPTVKEILHPNEDMVFTVEGRAEMIKVRERMLPLVRLARWLKLDQSRPKLSDGILIVLEAQGKTFCLAVDKVLGKQEVVIKSLGELLQEVQGVAGGAILGDGRVGLILDVDAIAGRPADA
jgi:two-component system, chemotaxis family, sensor kinase CheA